MNLMRTLLAFTVQHVTTKWLRLLGSKSTLTFSSGTCEIFIFSFFHRFVSPPLKTVDTSSRPLVYIPIWGIVTASETTGVFCCFFCLFWQPKRYMMAKGVSRIVLRFKEVVLF